jgi:hypothetical protein
MEEAATRHLQVTLRYFNGCPHWRTAYHRLTGALEEEGFADVQPVLDLLETEMDAERLHFVGSPTILLNGHDPFGHRRRAGVAFGLTCRVYETPDGLAGSPTS